MKPVMRRRNSKRYNPNEPDTQFKRFLSSPYLLLCVIVSSFVLIGVVLIKDMNEKQMELELTNKEILEGNAFERVAKDAETQIINEEKEKYANIREEMLKRMQKKEQCLKKKHDAVMGKLMKDREQQLLSIGQTAKDSVSSQEIGELERQYQTKQKELKKLQESYNARQHRIRHQILEESHSQNT
eukprot:810413_1